MRGFCVRVFCVFLQVNTQTEVDAFNDYSLMVCILVCVDYGADQNSVSTFLKYADKLG